LVVLPANTQEQLTHELNISFTTLNRWENSHTTPSRLARMRLIEYCTGKGVSDEIVAALKRFSEKEEITYVLQNGECGER
jgi:transcriptional regulator with XRE-family HTH domain